MKHEHIDDQMLKIEVTLDDMNPEFYGYIMDELFKLGVNDVYIDQIIMKKNRPGQVLNVLCSKKIKDEIVSFLFKETTTLGIRYTPYTVHRLERDFVAIQTEWGTIDVKIGIYKGEIVQIAPEYDQCVKIARLKNVPVKYVYESTKTKAFSKFLK